MHGRMRAGLCALLLQLAVPAIAALPGACPPAPQRPTPEAMQEAMRTAQDRGFLWRISKDGHSSYLYGTMHVAKPDWMFPGPRITQALQSTDTLALELDMLDAGIQERMSRALAQDRGSALPAALAQRMRRQAQAQCIPYDTLAHFTPELQVVQLGLMAARREGLDPAYGVDAVLAGIGHGAGKDVVSLETVELQLQTLTMRSPQETAAFVEDGLEELETGRSRTLIDRMTRAWSTADYAEMSRYDEWCECRTTELEREMMKRTLDDRNPQLADRIDALHASGRRVFAAVGSLHQFGPLGLPTLMEKRGYRVERIALAQPR
jgi:uncharacterized protein